ncbi:MAG: hypothetical protein ACYSW8_28320 [Planctomycetota bacterium]
MGHRLNQHTPPTLPVKLPGVTLFDRTPRPDVHVDTFDARQQLSQNLVLAVQTAGLRCRRIASRHRLPAFFEHLSSPGHRVPAGRLEQLVDGIGVLGQPGFDVIGQLPGFLGRLHPVLEPQTGKRLQGPFGLFQCFRCNHETYLF